MTAMRWIVVGAGAVGGVVGGLLANAGDDVTLIARGAHLDAMRSNGLRVRTPQLDVVVRCPAAGSIGEVTIGRRRRRAARGQVPGQRDRAQGAEQFSADPGAVIVCLQNGLENERIAARRFADVLSVPVMLPSTIVEPGVVAAWGAPHPGVLDVGRYPDAPVDDLVSAVASGFEAAGLLSRRRAPTCRGGSAASW